MSVTIHTSALVSPGARIGNNVSIGPYAVIGDQVSIGDGCRIHSHVVIDGDTQIGPGNIIHSHAVLGGIPQDKKYNGQPTRLEIGSENTIREFCTINIGTLEGGGVTRVGSHNWIMAYVHVAHDCVIGNECILANSVHLAGHVELGDWAVLGGMTGVHQFCKIGQHVMAGVGSVVTQDILPYVTVGGHPLALYGLNSNGLKRRGFDESDLTFLKGIYKTIFRSNLSLDEAKAQLLKMDSGNQQQQQILNSCLSFIEGTTRGIAR